MPRGRGLSIVRAHDAQAPSGRIIIVSNRLPITVGVEGARARVRRSSGGLATGLRGVQERWGAVWVGWSGLPSEQEARYMLGPVWSRSGSVAVPLAEEEIAGFYRRYSNTILWPMLHGWPDQPVAQSTNWLTYRAVNRRYAEVVAGLLQPGDRVWIHDYHLMLVPQYLRERYRTAHIGFFLHTPFPGFSSIGALAQCAELLEGMLGADVIGFHTPQYARRFTEAVAATLPYDVRGNDILVRERSVRICAEPMGIDVASFARLAADPEVLAEVRRIRGSSGASIFLGVDRLDYTKGIPQRLLAFERLLELYPELRGQVRLIQIAVPTREDVSAYRDLRQHVEAVVERVNSAFGKAGWTPIEYLFGTVDLNTLVALYRAADVMLVTPLRDGMNLVAKEFIASRSDGDGVLVLSRYAGAAVELQSALLASPTCVDQLARVYHSALTMSPPERRVRMRRLRQTVEKNDVFRWANQFLKRLPPDRLPEVEWFPMSE